jgi:AcrR family transcriptional regulator
VNRCAQCGAALQPSGKGRPRRYCSRSCQARAYRARRSAPPPRLARPASLTSERIAAAAVELADRTGLEALTMRRLATGLGVATMSLYRHYPSREALIVAMTDTVLEEIEPPGEEPTGWRARLEHEAREEWRLYRRHRWLLPAVATSRPPMGRGLLASAERILTGLAAPGADPRTLMSVYLAVSGLVQGLALLPAAEAAEHAATGQTMEEWWRRERAELIAAFGDEFPYTAEHFGPDGPPVDFDGLFEFALATLLDGLEAGAMSSL